MDDFVGFDTVAPSGAAMTMEAGFSYRFDGLAVRTVTAILPSGAPFIAVDGTDAVFYPSQPGFNAVIDAANAITAYDASKVVGEARPWEYYFQAPHTPTMHALEKLHDFIFVIITLIVILVMGLLAFVILNFSARRNPVARRFSHNTVIEIIWTTIPILILVAIGIPSLRVHYAYSHNQTIIDHPDLTLKVVGHQWYWSYEYPDQGVAFDSNVTQDKDLKDGRPRQQAGC